MPIVFEEIQGTVDSQPQEPLLPTETPPPPPVSSDPETIARAIRLLSQRKARLFAD